MTLTVGIEQQKMKNEEFDGLLQEIALTSKDYNALTESILRKIETLSMETSKNIFDLLEGGYYTGENHKRYNFPPTVLERHVRAALYFIVSSKIGQNNF